MRRITLWALSTLAALILLFSYRTSLNSTKEQAAAAGTPTAGDAYKGSVAATRWGDVQVVITVDNRRIVAVDVPVYPNSNGRDKQINARALPVLVRETIAKQSADIDTVSGATVTSNGYIESLQAALDAAHLS